MKEYVNVEKLIKIAVMSILSFFMIYAVASKKLQNYVNPRMNIVAIISAVILILIVIFTIPDLKRKKHTIFIKDYVILLIPIILVCVVPYKVYDSEGQASVDSSLSMSSSSDISKNNQDTKKVEQKKSDKKAVNPMVRDGVTWDVSDEAFANSYLRICGDMNFYEVQKIKLKGQFLRTNDFSKSEFVIARMAMVCCAADLQPCGFLCKYNDFSAYKTEQWISVTGTIHVEEYRGEKMPVIHVEKLAKAEVAKDKYIYFNR